MADLVASIKIPQTEMAAEGQRGLVVEVVGPAGAGKTTLIRALVGRDPKFQNELIPPVWNFRYMPFFVKHILLLAPILARMQAAGGRRLTRRELAWMAMLHGWPEILRKKIQGEQKAFLLDPGPIFLMTILSEFGPQSLRQAGVQAVWEKQNQPWMHTLDMVIYLDAADEILIRRIRTRKDEHLMKNKTDRETQEFLAVYRKSYARLIDLLTAGNRAMHVLRMDSGENSVDDLVGCCDHELAAWKWAQ